MKKRLGMVWLMIIMVSAVVSCGKVSDDEEIVTTVAGSAGSAGSVDATGTAARFNFPYSITTDGTDLYIADAYNNTIRKITASTGSVTTFAGVAGASGSANGTGTQARFSRPEGITSDGTCLYVADTGNNAIRKIVISTQVVTTLAGVAGSVGTADGTGTTARFNYPTGIATDGAYLYVADTYNHTIRKVVVSSGVVTTLAGLAGTAGSQDGSGSSAQFNYPYGIATTGTYAYVADSNNNTIRKIGVASGIVTTLAGTAGTAGSSDGTGTAARLNFPVGLAADDSNLYIADTGNNTIRKMVISSTEVSTLAGTAGTAGSTDGSASSASFNYPTGLTKLGGYLYVADAGNSIIRAVKL
jgi:sugar lactone lactonase YvrE